MVNTFICGLNIHCYCIVMCIQHYSHSVYTSYIYWYYTTYYYYSHNDHNNNDHTSLVLLYSFDDCTYIAFTMYITATMWYADHMTWLVYFLLLLFPQWSQLKWYVLLCLLLLLYLCTSYYSLLLQLLSELQWCSIKWSKIQWSHIASCTQYMSSNIHMMYYYHNYYDAHGHYDHRFHDMY